MCVDFIGDWKVANTDIIAYKVVSINRTSMYAPIYRIPQDWKSGAKLGRVRRYKKGSTVSCDGYGIYCFRTKATAEGRIVLWKDRWQVIEVMIPAGSRVRLGFNAWGNTINASQVTVMT